MAEVKLRFNLDAEEVELVVDGQIALSSGKEVFANWVSVYNAKNGDSAKDWRDKYYELRDKQSEAVSPATPVAQAPVVVAEPVVEVPTQGAVIESPAVETPEVAPVDNAEGS